jgi:uncharacterized Ntn-hydrolase superfamily protein
MRARSLAVLVVGVLVSARPAAATWSIVAVDPATREVGVAGASCYRNSQVIARVVPGRGAVAAQALSNLEGRDLAARRLAEGASPAEIVATLASARFDWRGLFPLHRVRQYGVAALGAPPASYTGSWTIGWAGAAQAAHVTVQGNILRGPEVVRDALAAFEASPAACTLGDRLMLALEAGAGAGGDRRCTFEQTALSAFVQVAGPEDDAEAPALRLVVPEEAEGGANPVEKLRHEYDGWRALRGDHRC